MRSKAIFMALLAFAFAAQGASVSRETAELAACGWARGGGLLGARIGSQVESSAEHATTNGAVFYSVKMWGGGTVFMSSDTEIEPVVAFTDSEGDFSEIDPKSPLWALLNRDMSVRRTAIDLKPVVLLQPKSAGASSGASSAGAYAGSGGSSTADAWAALIELGSEPSSGMKQLLSASVSPRVVAPGDLRVPVLMESTWNQAEVDGKAHMSDGRTCYNYYTPQDGTGDIQEGDKDNAVCGCVATAMGQVMFYHRYPESANASAATDKCWFSIYDAYNKLKSAEEVFLPVSTEPYDWDSMVASPWSGVSLATRQAIGRLTSDAGRAVGMSYSYNDSGSFTFKASKALVDVFRFGQSVYAEFDPESPRSSVGTLNGAKLGKVVYSNLDAGYPVVFGIRDSLGGGHEIVADGYGYQGTTPYVHLNMGWSGNCNVWYNLPNIDTRPDASYVFNVVDDAAYNIIPDGAGLGVMSGRVVDEDGEPVASASISVYDAGTEALVTQLVTTAYGVWGAALPGGSYMVKVADSGKVRIGEMAVSMQPPVQMDKEFNWATPKYNITNKDEDAGSGEYPVVVTASSLGNSWGNDIVLEYPRARIVVGIETNVYASLDAAISDARILASSLAVSPVVEILQAISLKADATIDFDCEIRAATGDESSILVSRPARAKLTVAPGVELCVSNCVFESAERDYPISVSAGGKVFVGPGFSGNVSTADVDGFNVIGRVTCDIAVDCAAATVAGQPFGHATTGDLSALSSSVSQIYASFDIARETRGTVKAGGSTGVYDLVWEGIPLPPEFSAGYYVDKNGTTNAFGRVNKLFDGFKNAADADMLGSTHEIVVVGFDEDGLSRDLVVTSPLVLRGVGGARLVPSNDSHIYVESGGSLVVKGVTIGDRSWDTFAYVRNGGSMTLGYGAVLTNLVCTANTNSKVPGPISVEAGGALTLQTGSEIVGCAATGAKNGGKHGGGVYVAKGGTLDLAGGDIRNCRTVNGSGGGVYAIVGANVVVSGPSVVSGNVSGKDDSLKSDDLYFNSQNDKVLVTNYVSGGSIGVRYSTSACNETNFVFATATSSAIASAAASAPALFFNDVNPSLEPGVTNGTDLAWFVPEPPPIPQEDLVALFVVDGVAITNGSLQAAFARLADVTNAVTVTLYSNCTFTADLVVPGVKVTLRSASASPVCVMQGGDCSFVVGDGSSLAVENVVFTSAPDVIAGVPLFSVVGGSLEFLDGAKVSGALFYDRAAAAVAVRDGAASGGTFTMHDGAEISCCTNFYVYETDRTAYSAGLFVNGMSLQCVARLDGGVITNCVAYRTGGVYVGNKGKIFLSGDVEISGNSSTKGADANLSVAADSGLVLEGGLTGSVGVRRDAKADRVIFGCVDGDFVGEASKSNVVASAMNFSSDDGYGYGIAVTGEDGVVSLAWSENIVDDGKYAPVSDSSVPFPVAPPVAAVGLAYTGEALTGVVSRVGYVLFGTSVATNAGEYVSVATLSPGYVWSDASSGEKTNNWSIARGTFDMSGVVFEDATERYDGNPKTLKVSGMLPEGVTVTYSPGTGVVNAGRYVFTAKFKVADPANYNAVPDKTATLTIVNVITKPTAQTGLVYNAAAQSGVVVDPKYVLSGDVSGVNAGIDYATVVSPAEFCVWPDMTTNGVKVAWQIAPAPLTIFASNAWKRVGMSDPLPFKYDVGGLQGTDAAEDVLSGSLDRAAGESKGQYAITQGTLAVRPDVSNYVIDNFTMAFLSIIGENDDPPGPGGAEPLPIAFTAIAGQDGKWTLTVTTTVAKCWYSLYETNSLAGGFLIDDVAPVTNRQADASVMTFERPSGGQQLFWRIRAEPENAH